MILDDFVMLGKTVPEANGDGRQFVCTAGYSLELRQPIRIYPMARIDCPPRWSVSRIPLERNNRDSRRESWKIRGDRSLGAHERINSVIEPVQKKISSAAQREIVEKLTVSSLSEANEKRLSLCIITPIDIPRIKLEYSDTAKMAPTPDMFGFFSDQKVAVRFRVHPRLLFVDSKGKHDLMLRDWGCYELMRKHGEQSAFSFDEALNLATAPPLFCGNFNSHRNSWLVISVFSGTVHARPEVFDNLFSVLDT